MKIAILGGGNLGKAMAKGLAQAGFLDKGKITLTNKHIHWMDELKDSGVELSDDNHKAVAESDIIILAVQPRQLTSLLKEIKADLNKHVVASVVTGVSIQEIQDQLAEGQSIIRVMPNTAIAKGESMTCIATNGHENGLKEVKSIFDALGSTLVIGEQLMQAATVIGASGIAFFLRYIRAATQGGVEVGFHPEEAQQIAVQVAKGAAALLEGTNDHPENAIDKVTTPMGCTIAGLNEMEHHGLSSAVIQGIKTSYKRIENIK
ncbi:MAG: pyrroline-5-carboxylate reductase [Cyclobacteriaceae bacterium]